MKQVCAAGFLNIVFLLISTFGVAQSNARMPSYIDPYPIAAHLIKTTNIIFPYPIKSVDHGSNCIIAQIVKGVDNILQIKAAKKDFEDTNLSIVTSDGKFYSFLVTYDSIGSQLNIDFSDSKASQYIDGIPSAKQLERESFLVLGMSRFMTLRSTEQALKFSVDGIYLSDNVLWVKANLRNQTDVDFQPAYVRFLLKDRKRVKRTSLRETEIYPISAPTYATTKGQSSSIWTIGFKPFTVPKGQRLIIQIGDEDGARVLTLRVKSKRFFRARKLPS